MMINYARQRAIQILKTARKAVLATTGPAGLQAAQFLCEAVDLEVYLLVPQTSDHLFNLEQNGRLALHTRRWELTGKGLILPPNECRNHFVLSTVARSGWYALVKVLPERLHILRADGWGPAETIDFAELL